MRTQAVTSVIQLAAGFAARVKYLRSDDTGNALAYLDHVLVNLSIVLLGLRMLCVLSEPWVRQRKLQWALGSMGALALAMTWSTKLLHNASYVISRARSANLVECFTSAYQYRILETFMSLLQQAPLYQFFASRAQAVLAAAIGDAILTSILASNHINTTALAHLPLTFITIVAIPYTVHNILPSWASKQRQQNHATGQVSNTSNAAATPTNTVHGSCCSADCTDDCDLLQATFKDIANKSCKGLSPELETANANVQQTKDMPSTPSSLLQQLQQSCLEMTAIGRPCKPSINSTAFHPVTARATTRATLPYTSTLKARHRQLSIKMKTDLQLAGLPHDLAEQLQSSLQDICGVRYSITNMAVRNGCLLIRADLLAVSSINAATEPHQGSHPLRVLDIAQALIPSLQPLVRSGASYMPTGEHVRVQLGDKLIRCHWDGATSDWQYAEELAYASTPDSAHMGLVWQQARMMTSQDSALSEVDLPCVVNYAGSGSASYSASPIAPHFEQPGRFDSQVQLAVQLFNLPSSITHNSGGMDLKGWTPATPGQHVVGGVEWSDNRATSSNRPKAPRPMHGLQVLAHAGGCYVKTVVLSLDPNTSKSGAAVATVCVELPSWITEQCHGAQYPPYLQLLTLELWSDELLVSSSTAILAPPQKHTSMPAATLLQPCWWWGSNPATVTNAVTELNNYMQQMQSREDMPDEAFQDLMQDLSIWLANVRSTAHSVGACIMKEQAGPASTRLEHPALDAQQLALIGSDLASYAASTGLVNVRHMLKQQLRFLKACSIAPTAVTAYPGRGWMATAIRRCQAVYSLLYVSANGLPCELCEATYRTKLSHQLAGIQAMYVGLMITIGSMAFSQALKDSEGGYILQFCLWLPWWYAAGFHHVRNSLRGELVFNKAVAGAQLAWTFNWAMMGLRIIALPEHVMRTHTSIITIPRDLMVSFGQQLLASAVLPAKYVTASSVVVCACIISLNLGVGPWYVAALLNVLMTVIARLVADIQLRRLLSAHNSTAKPTNKHISMMS